MKKYYSNYKGTKHKWVRKLLIVIAVCAAAFALTLLLGNYLNNKLKNAPINTEPIETEETTPVQTDQSSYTSLKSQAKSLPDSILGGYLDSSSGDAAAAVREFREKNYNSISFFATDSSGRIAYGSPAAAELSKTSINPSLISADTLKNVVNENSSLYFSAVYGTTSEILSSDSFAREIDRAVIAELEDIGFDDVVIKGTLNGVVLDAGTVKSLLAYTAFLRESAPDIMIGLEIPLGVLNDPECAPQIVLLSEHIDFLAIDLSSAAEEADPASYLSSVTDGLRGSFSAYKLRALIPGGVQSTADAEMQALQNASVSFIQFVSAVTPDPSTPPDTGGADPASTQIPG